MLIHQRHNATIRWYDDAQSIILTSITAPGAWPEALEVVEYVNAAILSKSHPVYTIYDFETPALSLSTVNMLSTLSEIMAVDPPNEALVIVVNNPTLRLLVRVAAIGKTVFPALKKYRFADTLNEALAMIADHRSSTS